MTKGAIKYVPKEFIEELENMKKKFNMGDSEACREIIRNSKIGREIRFTIDFNINRRKK